VQRKKLVATAGILSATAFAATVAIGANFGLVGQAEPNSPVGRLDDHRNGAAGATSDPDAAVTSPHLGPDADD
jgi:hypothetical protein